jgi:hypothetical protein
MKLLFIACAEGYNGDNGDLFVWANTKLEAVKLWRKHYELDQGDKPDRVFEVPLGHQQPDPHVLSWHKDIKAL